MDENQNIVKSYSFQNTSSNQVSANNIKLSYSQSNVSKDQENNHNNYVSQHNRVKSNSPIISSKSSAIFSDIKTTPVSVKDHHGNLVTNSIAKPTNDN